ncbi:MAG: 3-isopropylmalate dehydratase large subunit [Deltaproteobacteria bacterium]|nr:MAG: 3-isopropylmalate dehydratase large subunit [Desulfobacteraceae bacterium 4484_190.3]RLB17216.1 MAG: 3-isopropylmalate dehydratase large subunit [Deltaproteobacteria bacterium]
MPMTITEKILAAHAGKESVRPGDLVQVDVDLALANDITAPLAIGVFKELGAEAVFDREKIAMVQDHFVPNKDIQSAQQVKLMREFVREQGVKHFFELGETGIEHVILPEKGLVCPGDLVVGADSHTCTYGALGAFSTGMGSTDLGVILATGSTWLKVPDSIRIVYEGEPGRWIGGKDLILYTLGVLGVAGAVYRALEFTGEGASQLSMAHRFTMANMAVEAGAKNGIFCADDTTAAYMKDRSSRAGSFFQSDPDAEYAEEIHVSLESMEPQVALPHSPDNARPVSEVGSVRLDQVFLGSCTNGRLDDLREAASLLKGHRVAKSTRFIVIPGSPMIYREAIREGIIEVFLDAGAVIGPPCCGPCLGGHMGILAAGEKALSTSNRNFVGRMGHPESEVYLAGPAVAAASAIAGEIISPAQIAAQKGRGRVN